MLLSKNKCFAILRILSFSHNIQHKKKRVSFKIKYLNNKFIQFDKDSSQNTTIDTSIILFEGRLREMKYCTVKHMIERPSSIHLQDQVDMF